MTDRERLIELLDIIIQPGEKTLGDIADHLLSNGVVVSPYKVGETVYWYSIYNRLAEAKIVALDGAAKARVGKIDFEYELFADDLGKTVFLTKEEAEQALKERQQ